jgi:hypothetical protein
MAVAGMSQRPSSRTARSLPRLIKLRTPDSDMPTISATSRPVGHPLEGLLRWLLVQGANSFLDRPCAADTTGDLADFAVYAEDGKPAEEDQPVRKYGHHRSTGYGSRLLAFRLTRRPVPIASVWRVYMRSGSPSCPFVGPSDGAPVKVACACVVPSRPGAGTLVGWLTQDERSVRGHPQ